MFSVYLLNFLIMYIFIFKLEILIHQKQIHILPYVYGIWIKHIL